MRVAVEISQAHGLCMPRRLRLHGRGRAPVRRELISAAGCRTRRRQIALAGTNQPPAPKRTTGLGRPLCHPRIAHASKFPDYGGVDAGSAVTSVGQIDVILLGLNGSAVAACLAGREQ